MKNPLLYIFVLLAVPKVFGQTIASGLWKANTEISVNGIALPNVPVEDCISQKEAKDIRKYLQENLMPETSCKIMTWDYVKPNLKATLNCDGKQGKSQGKLGGTVTEKRFDIVGHLEGNHVLLGAVDIGIKYQGSYLKNCTLTP